MYVIDYLTLVCCAVFMWG